jgi:hypothetical protein
MGPLSRRSIAIAALPAVIEGCANGAVATAEQFPAKAG